MPDIFISYSKQNQEFADFLYNHLTEEGLSVFLASVSIEHGKLWSQEIKENLKNSNCVIFLASKAACQSPNVLLEIGGSVMTDKKMVPVVWDMPPEELPGWLNQVQAVDLRNASKEEISEFFSNFAKKYKMKKDLGRLVAGLLIAGFLLLGIRK
jgi:hypothetical protein